MSKNSKGLSDKSKVILAIFIIISSFVIATSVLYVYVLKPQISYNEAMELYDARSYEQAKAKFEEIKDFKDSAEKINDCQTQIDKNIAKPNLDDDDLSNSAYYLKVNEIIEKRGVATVQKDLYNADYGTYEVSGVCFVDTIDFNDDDVDELVVGYNDKNEKFMGYDVYTYRDGKVCEVLTHQEAEYRAQDCGYISFEFYEDDTNDKTYLYHWDNTCAFDNGYLKSFDGEKFVDYKEWHTQEKANGDIVCIVDGKEVDEQKYNQLFPNYLVDVYKGDTYVPLNDYHYEFNGLDVYAIYFLSQHAANELVQEVNENINELKESYDRVASIK